MTHPAIEAAALIYAVHRWKMSPSVGRTFDSLTQPQKHEAYDAARAAILAFLEVAREPSEGMLDAPIVPGRIRPKGYRVGTWEAMIDQLRKEIEG